MKDTPVKISPPPLPKSKRMVARKAKEHKIPIMKVGKSKKPSGANGEKRKRGRPKSEVKPIIRKPAKVPKKNDGRKRKSNSECLVPFKKPKIMNGDVANSLQKQKGENGTSHSINSNGTLHSKKTLMFNPKKNSISILKNATFHPPISLTKKELLNGSSNLSSFKLLPGKNKSSLRKDVDTNSLSKELETSSKTGKINNVSPLSQLTVSNELGRNLAKDIVQFCSKEPSKSKDATKLPSKETVKCQSKEIPKSILKESSKIHPKETPKPHVKDSGKLQTKDSSKSLHKEQVKPLIKDNSKPKDIIKPDTKEPSKSQPKESNKPQTKETIKSQSVKFAPVKSHPQRMASLDAMAKMHVICTTDRKPPEPRHTSVAVSPRPVTHQKSITQCHERIQFDVKKETNDMKGNIVHKQEINYVKEKQQLFVSHSVEQSSIVEREQSKTVSTKEKKKHPADKSIGNCKKLINTKLKQINSNHSKLIGNCPKFEKGKAKICKPKDGDRKSSTKVQKKAVSKASKCVKEKPDVKKTKKVEQTKSEVKVKETIRMQKTCTYQSVTTVNSHSSSANPSVVPVGSMTTNFSKKTVVTDEECKNKVNFSTNSVINNSYCLTTESPCSVVGPQSDCCKFHAHPQIIPLAHVQTCSLGHSLSRTSDASPSSSHSFSMHKFGQQAPIILAPTSPDCGCCCSGPLMQNVHDSCLLRKSIMAYPHLPSHHAHHLSAPAFSSETVCSDCHPSSPTLEHYTIPSPPHSRVAACCCESHHLHHHHHHHHYHQSGGLHYLSQSKTSSSLVPYEQSPLDLSLTSTAANISLESDINPSQQRHCSSPLCWREQQQLLLLRPHAFQSGCCKCSKQRASDSAQSLSRSKSQDHVTSLLASSPGPVHSVASTSGGPISPRIVTDDSNLVNAKREKSISPKQSSKRVFAHGWSWKGKPREKLIALTNDSIPCPRICYPCVQHKEGDTISERDCVLLRSGPKDTDLPYVAKIAAFWENPDDGEMMMSLLWYYRPEHTDQGRKTGQMEDEVFASRHKDVNSVACIEDKCYVLTYNEYCRYKASLSMDDDMVSVSSLVVPELPEGYPRKNRLPCEPVSQDIVFFCRHVYDFRQKRILKNPT